MLFTEEVIERVKEANDIVDIVSERVKLKRAGRNYMGLCPFHNEKTPSFSVSQERQGYKCFGCGEGGNVYTFVMKTRNLDFPDAVRYLAERANIPLEEDKSSGQQKARLDTLYRMHIEAARFYFKNLEQNPKVREYLHRRNINDGTIRSFGLGYSPDAWDGVLRHLRSLKFTEQQIIDGGLAIRNERGRVYDRFRNRIMYPVFDVRGRVIGFGARVLDDTKPKYLNSPETAIFQKGTNLYSLNFVAKNSKTRNLIIVEGYMDVISLYQQGVRNAVASLGTALTKTQARLMKRYCDEVFICYDADNAGQAATLRGLDILHQEGFKVRVVMIPKGKDPDDFIKENGKARFDVLLEEALPLIDYKILQARTGLNMEKEEEKISYARRVVEVLRGLDPVERDVYVQRVAEDTGISETALLNLLSSGRNAQESEGLDLSKAKVHIESAHVKAERGLLRIYAEGNGYLRQIIQREDFLMESHRRIFDYIHSYSGEPKGIRSYVEHHCQDLETAKEWASIMEQTEMPDIDEDVLIDDLYRTIGHYKNVMAQRELMKKIKAFEKQGMTKESLEAAKKLIELQKTLGRY